MGIGSDLGVIESLLNITELDEGIKKAKEKSSKPQSLKEEKRS